MAISEHDRQVLQEFENDLLVENQRPSPSPGRRRTAGLVGAFAGLLIGLLLVFAGLSLAGTIGTCVSVAGSLILIASAWLGVNNAGPRLRSRFKSGRDDPRS
jgi:Protein of unknown function (DUF3040)